ncbi:MULTISPECIES: hypothetical protein [unclassified Duganella]|uniref:hypothetical protein n=1 Tax=unclassified Duganella TaxID=2636909 RepID=UPI000873A08A|nr:MULTISPECIES: hypothetical protein [unclassified Duganella]OEZ55113.1 hypothetical protein DUGA6_55100 [Duganella sp. HH105]OFA02691.1 hypothetical protein DUGA2_35430 [Duganella sp. HH101]
MAGNYHQLTLAEVRPGMVLSDVLLDVQGHVLLPQGTVLTEAMLALMPRHGIAVLPILKDEVSPEVAQAALSRHEARIARLFRKNDADSDSDWATALLRRFVSDFRLGMEEAPEHE